MAKLRGGDDLVHWSVWYGCVLLDDGVVQGAAAHVATHNGWPDASRKVRQAQSALRFTERIVDSGDSEAALEQVREKQPALHRSIHCEPELDELGTGVRLVQHLTSLPAARARRARLPSLTATAD